MKVCFRHYKKNLLSVGFTFKDIFLDNLGGPGLAERPMRAELRFPEEAQILPVCDCFGVRLFRSVPRLASCPSRWPILPISDLFHLLPQLCKQSPLNKSVKINLPPVLLLWSNPDSMNLAKMMFTKCQQ